MVVELLTLYYGNNYNNTLTDDGIVPREDFVHLWMQLYGDNHADTNKFFDNLDANRDHQLTEADVIGQLSELGRKCFTNYKQEPVLPRLGLF